MGNIFAPVRLALNMPVHLGPKVSVQSYPKVKRVLSYLVWQWCTRIHQLTFPPCAQRNVCGVAPCVQNLSRDYPPWVMAIRGLVWGLENIHLPAQGSPNSGGIYHGTQRAKKKFMKLNFSRDSPILQVVNVVLLPPGSA